jgi:starvation-inducible DNA-binding protein
MMTSHSIEAQPVEQRYGELAAARLGLPEDTRHRSVAALNRLLAHSMAIRDLYKKSHWQTSGATFYALHLLFDKHHAEQLVVVDTLAERVQALGGVALALAHDVVEESRIARAPRGRESPAHQLDRLLDAHEFILTEARPLARRAAADGDDGTNDLIVGQLVRMHELQSWVIGEHVVAVRGSTGDRDACRSVSGLPLTSNAASAHPEHRSPPATQEKS